MNDELRSITFRLLKSVKCHDKTTSCHGTDTVTLRKICTIELFYHFSKLYIFQFLEVSLKLAPTMDNKENHSRSMTYIECCTKEMVTTITFFFKYWSLTHSISTFSWPSVRPKVYQLYRRNEWTGGYPGRYGVLRQMFLLCGTPKVCII